VAPLPLAGQAIALRSPGTPESSDDEALAPLLSEDDFLLTRERALEAVEVPASVLQLIADLRTYLQVGGAGEEATNVA
jgi:hypothetical protein